MKRIIKEKLNISNHDPIKARTFDYKKFTYPWHFHGEYELIYINEGFGRCIVGDNIIPYYPKNLIIFGPSLPHCMQNDEIYDKDEKLRVNGAIIQFEKDFMQYSFSNYIQFIHIYNLLNESLRGVVFDLNGKEYIQENLINITCTEGVRQIILLLEVLQQVAELPKREFAASPNFNLMPNIYKDKKIEKIISYINREYTKNITLEDIANYAAMNPSAFCRFFKENTGKTLKQYITEMKIGYACKLLADDRHNISQIANICGFESISHFNRCFKKNKNITPSEYKRDINSGENK